MPEQPSPTENDVNGITVPPELAPLSIPVPPHLAETFGYPGKARFVGFYWEPTGDEVEYDDGRFSGTGDGWAFLTFRRHPAVAGHLDAYNLGYSDLEASHALVLDRQQSQMYVAAVEAARAFLRSQHPPFPALPPQAVEQFAESIKDLRSTGWKELRVDPEVVAQRMKEQQQAMSRMVAYLDAYLPDEGRES